MTAGSLDVESLWPWLAVAGLGAVHGLNPVTGWLLAAASALRSRDRGSTLRALVPIGLGHVASIAWVAGAMAFGLSMDRALLQAAAGGLLLVAAALHLRRRAAPRLQAPAGRAALALGSFMTAHMHGAGLMLVPVLMPLCGAGQATREIAASRPLMLAIAAVGVHATAMLAMTGLVATLAGLAVRTARQMRHDDA